MWPMGLLFWFEIFFKECKNHGTFSYLFSVGDRTESDPEYIPSDDSRR